MKSVKKKGRQRRRVALWVFLALLILLIGLLGYGAINASTLYVRRAEVYVPDLPSSFEGLKLLYVSDIDICGINTAERAAEAINRLQELKPDVLIFGGDYTSSSLLQLLNRTQDAEDSRDTSSVCEEFFSAIREFPAPLGRIAIVSPEDDAAALEPVMRESGFQPLINASIGLSNGSDRLWFVGICDDHPSTIAGMNHFQKNDCVVCVTYGPSCFPQMMTLEASDSGPWVDLALAELEDCIPSSASVEQIAEDRALISSINRFLCAQPQQKRSIFIRRYWYLYSIRDIAEAYEMRESKAASMLLGMIPSKPSCLASISRSVS